LTALCLPVMAGTIPISGLIRTADGDLFNGRIRLMLSHTAARDKTANNTIVTQQVEYPVNNGALPSDASITPNDVLEPADTFYSVHYFSAAGRLVAQNAFYITGKSFDLGSAPLMPLTTSKVSLLTELEQVSTKRVNSTRYCDQFPGTTAGTKIAA